MSELVIQNLHAGIPGKQILFGIDLVVRSGEVHAIMGPNGAGKSTLSGVMMGKPGYNVISGSVTLDGEDLLALPTWKRAAAGLFLAMQYPTEVPGVAVERMLAEALRASGRDTASLGGQLRAEADRIGFDHKFLDRAVNVDLSGGEKKRNETLQMSILKPRFAVLDELDSGLDVDALRACARRVADASRDDGVGVLAITHYNRLLDELRPDRVHILVQGRIVASGGPELAEQLETDGYGAFVTAETADRADAKAAKAAKALDPFADPFA
jgi:Fe-S cluster assembly ATP-binding protein